MTTDAVVVDDVHVAFGQVNALDGVDLRVPAGTTLAVLGHNGAGKTTLIRVLTTRIRPDHGHVLVDGIDAIADPVAVRSRIGGAGYGLRPTRWTRAGAWHRTLSWHDALPQWRGGIRMLPEHERILSRIHDSTRHASGSTTYFTQVPPISIDASPEIWPLLVEAIDAGVELLPGEGVVGPVHVASEPATLTLAVMRADDGSGDLVLRVNVEGLRDLEGEALYLGDPVHGIAVAADDGSLALVPLDQDLELGPEALAQALTGMRVPADERARFLGSTVPGLRQRVRVRSQVPLPAPTSTLLKRRGSGPSGPRWRRQLHARRTRLAAAAGHRARGVGSDVPGEVRLDLGYAYDGMPRPFTTQRFGGGLGGRDRDAELRPCEPPRRCARCRGHPRRPRRPVCARRPASCCAGSPPPRSCPTCCRARGRPARHRRGRRRRCPTTRRSRPRPSCVSAPPTPPRPRPPARVAPAGPAEPGDWFDLRVTVEVEGEDVPFEPLFGALARGEEVMFLDSGSWFRLDRPELHRLRALIDEARELADPESGGLRLSAHHADLWDELVALGVVDEQSARWAANVEALGSLDDGPPRRGAAGPPGHPAPLPARRLPLARAAVGRPHRRHPRRRHGPRQDDAGHRHHRPRPRPWRGRRRRRTVLVIAPTSVVGTWLGELATFAPHLPVVPVTATERKRGVPLAP